LHQISSIAVPEAIAEIGDLFGVARSTVYRAVARSKKAALAAANKRPVVNASVPALTSRSTD
jgi:hypothetical protein